MVGLSWKISQQINARSDNSIVKLFFFFQQVDCGTFFLFKHKLWQH